MFKLGHELVDKYGDEPIAWYCVGSYYCLVGKYDEAKKYFSKATQLDKKFALAWIGFGHSFSLTNEHDRAISAYNTASNIMMGSHWPLVFLGMEYSSLGNYEMASKYFSMAFDQDSSDPFLLNEMAVLALKRNLYIDCLM